MSENDAILPEQTGEVKKPSTEPNPDTAQEIHPVTFFNKDFSLNGAEPTDADLEAGAYDFRPKSPEHMALVEAEFAEESDPKDSSAQESAESSQSQTQTETESPASQEQTVLVGKGNTLPKAEGSGQPTSSDPATPGKNEPPAGT